MKVKAKRAGEFIASLELEVNEFMARYQIDIQNNGIYHCNIPVSYTHLRAHETVLDLVCRLLLEKKKHKHTKKKRQDYERHIIIDNQIKLRQHNDIHLNRDKTYI